MGLGVVRHLPLEVGVGQIVQGDGGTQTEQVAHPFEQGGLQHRLVTQQTIGDPVQGRKAQGLVVHVQQLAQPAALSQPGVGGQLRGRRGHAPDNRAQGRGPLRTGEAQQLQQSHKIHLPHGPQGRRFNPHGTRTHQGHGIHIHRMKFRFPASIHTRRGSRRSPCRSMLLPPGHQLGGDALRMVLDPGRTVHWHQGVLVAQPRFDAGTQQRPVRLIHIEMAPQVEQGDLPDFAVDPFGLDQPMGVVAFAGGGVAGLGASNEHSWHATAMASRRQEVSAILWHYKAKCRPGKPKIKELLAVLGKFGVEADKYGLTKVGISASEETSKSTSIGNCRRRQASMGVKSLIQVNEIELQLNLNLDVPIFHGPFQRSLIECRKL